MPVILARRRTGGDGQPPPVHAYRVPHDPASVDVWRSVCGVELKPAEAEVLPRFVGAPCSVCLLAAFGQDAANTPTTREQRSRLGTRPAIQPVSPSGRWAVAVGGEREAHLVGSNAPRSQLDGREVVHVLCGHLGWGPLESPPPGWPVCAECSDAAGGQ